MICRFEIVLTHLNCSKSWIVALNPAKIFVDASGKPLPGFINTDRDPLDGGLPRISFATGGLASLGAGTNMPQGRATNTYEVIENISLVSPWGWTRHTLRFGGHYRHEITNRFLNGNYRGAIVFPDFAGFAAGQPQSGSLRTGEGGTFRTWGAERGISTRKTRSSSAPTSRSITGYVGNTRG